MSIREEKSATLAFRSLLNPTLDSARATSPAGTPLADLLLRANTEKGTDATRPPPMKHALPKAGPTISPRLLGLVHAMVEELDQKRTDLLKLNPSRRTQLCEYLEKVAGITSQKTSLQDWIYGNTPNAQAILSYLEEVALITLAQICVLKRWSEKGLRPFEEGHIGKLNWELSHALKPYIPLHREGWHLTRPNLYSWYAPSAILQKEIFRTLAVVPLAEESPGFLADLCREGRRFGPDFPEQKGYDPRLYSELAKAFRTLDDREGYCQLGNRKKHYFTPTLRFGDMAHHRREEVQWIGFEENAYALLVAEVVELWSGPKAPPTWCHGNSLEAHPREQLMLAPAMSGRTGLVQMITEMEACEIGFLLEERNHKASKLKAQLEQLPFFRKLRATGTTLGTLQACVSVTKIRPGGRFIWAREEPISQDEGAEALGFILGRTKLLAEWNLSGIEHSLPTRAPLFPKYFYLFERETDGGIRNAHRPKRVYARGAIRSHIEVPILLEDIFSAISADHPIASRTHCAFQVHESPIPQKEWPERWPDQACVESLRKLEKLQQGSIPLAQIGTVRSAAIFDPASRVTPASDATLIVTCEEDPRRLKVHLNGAEGRDQARALAIILRDPAWTPVIAAYLESGPVQAWLEHHVEKRSEKWNLTETVLKLLPIPSLLLMTLERTPTHETAKRAAELSRASADSIEQMSETGWARFIVLSRARETLRLQKAKLLPLMNGENVNWSSFIRVFSRQDCFNVTQHPMARVEGRIPPNSPIAKIDRLKGSVLGISFMTDRLETMKVVFEQRVLQQIVWDQVKDLRHPTWSEIVSLVQIPRALEVAESSALDLASTVRDLRLREKMLEERLSMLAVETLGFQD